VLIRNQIIVPYMTVELSSWLSASRRCFMTSRVGMYLNWNRSRQNTASTAHMHTHKHRNFMSVRVVVWAPNKGTHDAEGRPCRAQHLSQNSSLATDQSLLQSHSTATSWKISTSYSLSECWPFSRTVHDRLFPPTSRGTVGAVPLSGVPCQSL